MYKGLIVFLISILLFTSCQEIKVYEHHTNIPAKGWLASDSAKGSFDINDTTSSYRLYIVLRHKDSYHFGNIWLNVGLQSPNDTMFTQKINFNLDMPEDEQGAIGGQVYGRVQQLNQQEDELNRQVFSLLVLNRFYPDPGSDGSAGGVATIARDNLNDAVSDQLNVFSDKIFGKSGFELNFGLDSYTDYQGNSPQDRTQLDIAAKKKFFNDRLIVSVGSEVDVQGSSSTGAAAPIIGNVSIEYILTENGRYRLKGFRRNEFENVIDGQTIVSGIALIFTQEFNKFSELWDALVKSTTKKEKQLEVEKKAAEEAQKAKEEATDESIEKKKN